MDGTSQPLARDERPTGWGVTKTLVVGALIVSVGFGTNVVARGAVLNQQSLSVLAPIAPVLGLGFDAKTDTGSLSAIARIVGAQKLWQAGGTGKGVDVALIDTGVTPVPGLDHGNVIHGPDLSFDSQTPSLAHLDGFGHGTHMASIIAGSDEIDGSAASCADCLNDSPYSDVTKFEGIAPQARVISIKVGASDGAVDVTQMVAGIEWAIAHRHDEGKNIRVINISYGTNSAQSYMADPIAFAAEKAWNAGMVVVASGGNDGLAVRQLGSPAYSPTVLSVGTSDPNDTIAANNDTIPHWANHGTSDRPVDVVAPGVHVLGLRVPGSVLDIANPNAVVGSRFFRGSGTSQSAAVVSGLVADILQLFPTLKPDQVKQLLRAFASPIGAPGDGFEYARGQGVVEGSQVNLVAVKQLLLGTKRAPASLGTGTLEAARGGEYVSDGTNLLTGEIDIFGSPWSPVEWTADAESGSNWVDGIWTPTARMFRPLASPR